MATWTIVSAFPCDASNYYYDFLLTPLSHAKAPCGTIIHPSVYFVRDVYDRLGFTGELNPYVDGLNNFQMSGFVKHEVQGSVSMDPWRASLADLGGPDLKSCRVLVCGRAGVGKSTLINKVFGSIVVSIAISLAANMEIMLGRDHSTWKLTIR